MTQISFPNSPVSSSLVAITVPDPHLNSKKIKFCEWAAPEIFNAVFFINKKDFRQISRYDIHMRSTPRTCTVY